jgi:inorganic pyrophosphatase|tara:strand:- start:3396 stop:3923 length:528 start_codon:yes stop_codon:yes gene_type:complete
MQNLLHLNQHKEFPEIINTIVEIPKDTNTKYEYDHISGLIKLDRCLISSLQYPANYGFIPSTKSEDGDPVDVLIFNSAPLHPLTLVEVRVLGALVTYDHGKKDYKVIGVPLYNPNEYKDIDDIDPMFLTVASEFFRIYKKVNRKPNPVKVKGWIHNKQAKEYLQQHFIGGANPQT